MKWEIGCFTAFISVFYLVGIAMLGHGFWAVRRSTLAASWPTVPGTITELSLQKSADSEGDSYQVKVGYNYAVEGVDYQGACLAFGYAGSSGKQAHDQIHQKLKSAKSVAVRYDPSEPSVSCLSFGLHRSLQLELAFAFTWLAFTIGFTLLFWLFSRSDSVLLDNLSVQ
jgi:hypothetical protein